MTKRNEYKYWITAIFNGQAVSGDTAPTLEQAIESAKTFVADGCEEVHIWPSYKGEARINCSGDTVRSFYTESETR